MRSEELTAKRQLKIKTKRVDKIYQPAWFFLRNWKWFYWFLKITKISQKDVAKFAIVEYNIGILEV